MQVLQFDEQEIAMLRALRFEIKDGDVATLTDEITVEIIHPAGDHELLLSIGLPNGSHITCRIRPYELRYAAGMEEEDE
jgi:hypothetical protein